VTETPRRRHLASAGWRPGGALVALAVFAVFPLVFTNATVTTIAVDTLIFAASAVAGPTAAALTVPSFTNPALCSFHRPAKNRTAFWLANKIQSNSWKRAIARSTASQFSGGAKRTAGSSSVSAPNPSSAANNFAAWSAARVTTMRFPASGLGEPRRAALSASNRPSRETQNSLRARFPQRLPEPSTNRFRVAHGTALISAKAFLSVR